MESKTLRSERTARGTEPETRLVDISLKRIGKRVTVKPTMRASRARIELSRASTICLRIAVIQDVTEIPTEAMMPIPEVGFETRAAEETVGVVHGVHLAEPNENEEQVLVSIRISA
jgi:hypothetical protein